MFPSQPHKRVFVCLLMDVKYLSRFVRFTRVLNGKQSFLFSIKTIKILPFLIFVDILVTHGFIGLLMFQISPFYYSHVCGLCGNFDGKQGNEFQSPSRTDRSDSSCLVLDYLVPDSKCDSQSIRKECQQPQSSSCKCSCGC